MQENQEKIECLRQMARRMRIKAIDMAYGAGESGAHLGPALSCMEIFAVLYGNLLRYDTANPAWEERDRFIPSKAHCVLAYYTALREAGFLTEEDLLSFEKPGTCFAGHPSRNQEKGIEYSGGSLGMALSVGVGMALGIRKKQRGGRVFILLGDGELDEGSNWEAILSAAHFRLSHLTAIIDKNQLQYDGNTEEVMALGDLQGKFERFGWEAKTVDGHDIGALLEAFAGFHEDRPHVLIAETVKGKGVSFMEGKREWHHSVLKKQEFDIARKEIQGDGL